METPTARCLHRDVPIVDETTQVTHSDVAYCCSNCSTAMERTAGGSDPSAPHYRNDVTGARCNVPIVNEKTMEERGGKAYCCRNCAEAATVPAGRGGAGARG